MPYTTQEFAARIKAKYPQYANVPDDELTSRVIAKYPQYASQVEAGRPAQDAPVTAAPVSSVWDTQKQVVGNAVDFGKGVLKGAGSTAYNLGKIVTGAATGDFGAFDPANGPNDVTRALEAKGPWQTAGKAAEQIGEFFLPGGAPAKMVSKIPGAAKAPMLAKMGSEALGAAGVTAAQGGDASTAATSAAATVPALAAVGKVAPRMVNSLIQPTKKSFLTGGNAGRGVVDSGMTAGSLGSLAQKIDGEKEKVGAEIGKMLGLMPAGRTPSIDATAIIDGPITDATTALNATGNTAAASRLANLRAGLYDAFTQMGVSPNAVTPAQAFTVKKLIDKAVRMTPSEGPEASVIEVTKTVRRGFAQAIEAQVPEVAPLNHRFADLAEADKAVMDKLARTQGMKLFSPANLLAGAGAGMAYFASHPAVAAGVLGTRAALNFTPTATGLAQVARVAGSPAAQTGAAKTVAAGASAITQEKPREDPREEYFRRLMTKP